MPADFGEGGPNGVTRPVGIDRALKALLLLIVLSAPNVALGEIVGVASVVDGDTLQIRGTSIRLHGIDAPETGQTCSTGGDVHAAGSEKYRCGRQAALALADRIDRDPVYCEERDTDRYGRLVAVCWLNDEDLGAWMVREGWALAYREYSPDYVPDEELAQAALRGIWRGDFIKPWDWREERRPGSDRTGDEPATAAPTLTVEVRAANVRATPSRNGRLVTTLRRGETVEEIGRAGEWYHVRLRTGVPGWIFGELLGPAEARRQAERPARTRPRPARTAPSVPSRPAYVAPQARSRQPYVAPQAQPRQTYTAPRADPLPDVAPSRSRPRACCKVCSRGQPCGNSCISWGTTCRQPPGCAC
jgi:endonuclease YncB( thermonuclease family)